MIDGFRDAFVYTEHDILLMTVTFSGTCLKCSTSRHYTIPVSCCRFEPFQFMTLKSSFRFRSDFPCSINCCVGDAMMSLGSLGSENMFFFTFHIGS